jgi:hypothetical protein|tara:strand:+ start:364 stop:477 length:114 start_codon:yes stop_codon:yes gene_type:complete
MPAMTMATIEDPKKRSQHDLVEADKTYEDEFHEAECV